MQRVKLLALAVIAVLAIAGVAKASGVMGGGHQNREYDIVEAKVERLEAKLEARSLALSGIAARGRRGPRGPRGFRGPQGATGPAGPKGTFGSVTSVSGQEIYLCSVEAGACAVGSSRAECPPGTILSGGGYTGGGIVTIVPWSAPIGNAWAVIAVNLDEAPVEGFKAVAECASA